MITASAPSDAAVAARRRNRRERTALLLLLLALGLLLAWVRLDNRRDIEAEERSRLEGQARAIEQALASQVGGVYAALLDLRDDLSGREGAQRAAFANPRLEALCKAMPVVASMTVLDAAGVVEAGNQPQWIGRDVSSRPYLAGARQRPDRGALIVSTPFRHASGEVALDLALVLTGGAGEFTGAVAATLNASQLSALLGSVLYAPDMSSWLVHGGGRVVAGSVASPDRAGLDLAQPGTLFSRYLALGKASAVVVGSSLSQGDLRMVAMREMRPAGLPMDQPLVVAVSRNVDALMAPWQRQTAVYAALFTGAALLAGWMLLAQQRTRDQVEARAEAQRQRAAADAERLALALSGGDLALWDADLVRDQTTVNERWFSMLGWREGEIGCSEADWMALLHPEDRGRVVAALREHVEGRSDAFEQTYRLRHRDGHWLWVLDRGRVVERDSQGRALRLVGTHMDISDRMRAEETLRRSEQKSRALLDALRSGVVVHGADTQVLDANPAACRILGLTLEQMRGKAAMDPSWHFIESDHAPMPLQRYPVKQVQASGQPLKNFLGGVRRADQAQPTWVLCNAYPLHAGDGSLQEIVVTFADITERKQAEEELQRSEARLRMAGRVARLGGWYLEVAPCRLVLSPELRTMLDLEPTQAIEAEAGCELVVPEQRQAWRARLTQCMRDGQDLDEEVDAFTASGRRVHLRVIGEALRDAGGRTLALQGAVQDITETKQADAAMRAAREDLAATLDAVPDLLFDVDSQGRIHGYHSPRGDLLLTTPQQFVGCLIDEVLPPETAAVVRTALVQAWVEGHSGGLQYELDLPAGRRWFELSVAPKPAPAGAPARFIVLARDVTERRQAEADRRGLERQLREAQKMESIGTLAGGIAHDFNNILAAILGNAALAQAELPAGHAAAASLEQIQRAGLRARTLVQQILTFSRRQPNALLVQALRPIVDETLALLRATLPGAVRLDTVLPEAQLLVEADATQLQQVLMNLCTNAWHALPEGRGRIEIGFEAVGAAARETAPPPMCELPPGPLVHLWVRDNGIGMDTATRERIFDPFFTTKPVGQGTGLGLSVVHGIVRGHRGAIAVDTAPGQGSSFHIALPCVADAGQPAGAAADAAATVAAGAGQQLLYVDDDEVMVLMVQRLLRREGYGVAACGDAQQALTLVQADLRRFDLVISDFNMPEASGLELTAQLMRLRRDLPVIISSGYITDALRAQADALGVRALLQKERTLEELPTLVAKVLAEVEQVS